MIQYTLVWGAGDTKGSVSCAAVSLGWVIGVAGFKERGGGVGWTSLSSEGRLLCASISMSTVGMVEDNW